MSITIHRIALDHEFLDHFSLLEDFQSILIEIETWDSATLTDAGKYSDLTNFSVTTRMCSQDTDVCGYHIPKGAKVVVNMMAIHSDPELWGPEPVDQFVPER